MPSRAMFQFAVQARVVMAPVTNLALALEGHGDLDFAQKQLNHAVAILEWLERGSLWE